MKKRGKALVKWNPKKKDYIDEILKESKHPGDFVITMLVSIGKYVKNAERKINVKDIAGMESNKHHACNQCGKCCTDSQRLIPLYPTDLLNYVASKKGFILVSTAVTKVRSTGSCYVMFDRKGDFLKKVKYHTDKYNETMINLNPGLALIEEKEKDECVFFNNADNTCSIEDMKPVGCKSYPYILKYDEKGKILVSMDKEGVPCDNSCYVPGEPSNLGVLKEILSCLVSNQRGLNLFYKAKMHSSNDFIFKCYMMLIDALYYCYSNFVDVGVIEEEKKNAKRNTNTV